MSYILTVFIWYQRPHLLEWYYNTMGTWPSESAIIISKGIYRQSLCQLPLLNIAFHFPWISVSIFSHPSSQQWGQSFLLFLGIRHRSVALVKLFPLNRNMSFWSLEAWGIQEAEGTRLKKLRKLQNPLSLWPWLCQQQAIARERRLLVQLFADHKGNPRYAAFLGFTHAGVPFDDGVSPAGVPFRDAVFHAGVPFGDAVTHAGMYLPVMQSLRPEHAFWWCSHSCWGTFWWCGHLRWGISFVGAANVQSHSQLQ